MAKTSTSFTEQLLKDKKFVEVKPGMFIKANNPIKSFIKKIEVPNSTYRGKKRSKYNVGAKEVRTFLGVTYDSVLEMEYAKHLLRLVGLKQVKYFDRQVVYQIELNGVKICKYRLDFAVYYDDGRIEYVDCKGFVTAMFRLKKKLVEAQFGIKITEVKKGDF